MALNDFSNDEIVDYLINELDYACISDFTNRKLIEALNPYEIKGVFLKTLDEQLAFEAIAENFKRKKPYDIIEFFNS